MPPSNHLCMFVVCPKVRDSQQALDLHGGVMVEMHPACEVVLLEVHLFFVVRAEQENCSNMMEYFARIWGQGGDDCIG